MAYLAYIEDCELKEIVKSVLDIGIKRKQEAETKFTKNVIDPFAALFESAAFNVNHQTWKDSETIRQCQKTLQNHVGELHQKILGKVVGWQDLGVGSVVDLVSNETKVIAEIKNKYNTVTGGKLADQYYSLERLIMPKNSIYKGYSAYFVNIIPSKPERYSKIFQPSDKDKGVKCPANEKIRIIDGASFYNLVTGRPNALEELYQALPKIIEDIFVNDYQQAYYQLNDKAAFANYFSYAFKNNHD